MSDSVSEPTKIQSGPTAGALLRQAREAAGLHIAALAVLLKVPVKKLEALEQDRVDLLPDAGFARALAQSVCRTLKVDPTPVLERMPAGSAIPIQRVADGINTPFHTPGERSHSSVLDNLSKPVVLTVLALLVAALVVIMMPSVKSDSGSVTSSTANGTTTTTAVGVVAEKPSTNPELKVAPIAAASEPLMPGSESRDDSAKSGIANPEAPAVPVVPAAPDKTASESLSSRATQPTEPEPPITELIVLKAKSTAWVEITDAKKAVLVRKTLQAGEEAGASGWVPLSVVVGSADAVTVKVRGKDFDLAPFTRSNVAKLEVK